MSLRRLANLFKNSRTRLNSRTQLVQKRRIKNCSFWARTTTVFVSEGYLNRVTCRNNSLFTPVRYGIPRDYQAVAGRFLGCFYPTAILKIKILKMYLPD